MNTPKAFGVFEQRGMNIYRTAAYIQWGISEQSIGASLLLHPGSAVLDENTMCQLQHEGKAAGEIKQLDTTMRHLIRLVERIYGQNAPISGRLYIYNLFTLQAIAKQRAIEQFEQLVEAGEYDVENTVATVEELQRHPWIVMGWGINTKAKWKHLRDVKNEWRQVIEASSIFSFGKKHENNIDYYHICPKLQTEQLQMLDALMATYEQGRQANKQRVQRFSIYATKPNMLPNDENSSDAVRQRIQYEEGWQKSKDDPERIVKGYSQLRIKEGYQLKAYQFFQSGNGNGAVWAIPAGSELPHVEACEQSNDFLSSPKPTNALDDFMEAIEGDRTPLSYLQAAIVFHELHEFGAIWHGVSWWENTILPEENLFIKELKEEWTFLEEEPRNVDPMFYYNEQGNPVIVFYTLNRLGRVEWRRYEHTFHKHNYTLHVHMTYVATAGPGIIF